LRRPQRRPQNESAGIMPQRLAFALNASCTIREGAALKAELLNLAGAEQTVVLDVQAVERIDTAALQLLCAFVRDRRAQGWRTSWTGNPQAFSEAVDILGLNQVLGYATGIAA
jgi:anti-anti-sigma regulatory factor